MNIGIVTTWFPAGAGYVSSAYRQLLKDEHNVFIYARQGKNMQGDPEWDGDYVHWGKPHYNGIKLKDFKKWIVDRKIDLIFFNEQRYFKPVIEAKKMGICIGAYIDYYKEDTVGVHSVYDFLVCNTKRHYSVFDWHPNANYVPWGVDLNVFKPVEKKNNGKVKFLISLGWEGQYLGDRKGLMFAIQAFTQTKGDCELLVYSQLKIDQCCLAWKSLLESDNRIKFIHGTYSPFPYNVGDVYLYPSRLDGIGLSLPEALASGLPAITTDNPPMNEFVSDGENGFLVDVDRFICRPDGYYWAQSICKIESLAKAIQQYIDEPKLVGIQGDVARKKAQRELDWMSNKEHILKIFSDSYDSSDRNMNSNDELIALNIDKKYSPTYSYRILCILNECLRRYGFSGFIENIKKIVK